MIWLTSSELAGLEVLYPFESKLILFATVSANRIRLKMENSSEEPTANYQLLDLFHYF